ncbi:hypothetical protein ACQ9BO_16665 [Flavobacterium sp. P21]|uniref:hypothetical protein n=1 Tax=Flavobacterium sp. P21 TaxID=3423948 RepID=UPI003D66E3B2
MKTKTINLVLSLTLFALAVTNTTLAQNSKSASFYKDIEFKMAKVQEPIIPKNTVNLKDFGAVSGGYALNTKAFADAIDALSKKVAEN